MICIHYLLQKRKKAIESHCTACAYRVTKDHALMNAIPLGYNFPLQVLARGDGCVTEAVRTVYLHFESVSKAAKASPSITVARKLSCRTSETDESDCETFHSSPLGKCNHGCFYGRKQGGADFSENPISSQTFGQNVECQFSIFCAKIIAIFSFKNGPFDIFTSPHSVR